MLRVCKYNYMESKTIENEVLFEDKLIKLNRVAKAVKGGRRFSFSALVIVGDRQGTVGYGQGKANDVAEAIRKGVYYAKKELTHVVTLNDTIPHEVLGKYNSARVILKPAAPGTGVIAGGVVRVVLELCGIRDALSKCLGSRNPINVVKAVFDGLSQIRSKREVAVARNRRVKDLWQ